MYSEVAPRALARRAHGRARAAVARAAEPRVGPQRRVQQLLGRGLGGRVGRGARAVAAARRARRARARVELRLLDGEVPVRQRHARVDELQRLLEAQAEREVHREEAEPVVHVVALARARERVVDRDEVVDARVARAPDRRALRRRRARARARGREEGLAVVVGQRAQLAPHVAAEDGLVRRAPRAAAAAAASRRRSRRGARRPLARERAALGELLGRERGRERGGRRRLGQAQRVLADVRDDHVDALAVVRAAGELPRVSAVAARRVDRHLREPVRLDQLVALEPRVPPLRRAVAAHVLVRDGEAQPAVAVAGVDGRAVRRRVAQLEVADQPLHARVGPARRADERLQARRRAAAARAPPPRETPSTTTSPTHASTPTADPINRRV